MYKGGKEHSTRIPVLWLTKHCPEQVATPLGKMYETFMKAFLVGHTKRF